jgi:limonene-1,2-epoxide hydrolase
MNRRNVEEALTMFTDDGVYAVAVQTSTGKNQVRTYFEYMDAIRMRVTQTDCKMEGAQLVCMQWRQDDSMSAYGFTGVRLKFVYSFQGDKIQKALGAPEGPEWPAYSAMSKDATTWMAANRADEWKKVSDEKGGLIRNGQTGPAIMKLAQDYAKTIQIAPAPTDLIGLANAYVAAMNRRDIEAAIALFTDDADYDAGVHSGAGKDRVRTILDYMDGTGMRMAHSDCSVKDAQAVCVQWRQDESMRALGYPGVRLRVTFSFKDGKIQHVAGTPEGPEYAQYIAATKEAMTWMAASRAEAWKKISDDKGALIRNGQTGPAVIKLVQEYANEKAKKGVSQ